MRIVHLYGLTETYGPHVTCEMQPGWETLDVEGRARVLSRQGVPHVTATHLRVVDDAMQDVPADAATLGEVVMRGNNVMKGYFQDPEATETAFAGGWFHSGDLGVVHPDGYIELRDRKKDIIISGGENISTIEVEHTVVKHPAVLGVRRRGHAPRALGRGAKGVRDAKAWRGGYGARDHRVLSGAPRTFQVSQGGGVLRAAEDVHRQDPEVPPAGEGVGGPREADPLTARSGERGELPGQGLERIGVGVALGQYESRDTDS